MNHQLLPPSFLTDETRTIEPTKAAATTAVAPATAQRGTGTRERYSVPAEPNVIPTSVSSA